MPLRFHDDFTAGLGFIIGLMMVVFALVVLYVWLT